MKKTILLLLLIASSQLLFCQDSTTAKIKIALIGTLHFEPSTVDMYKNKELTVSSEKRQREIKEVVDKIKKFKPDQICIEYPLQDQKKIDAMYNDYLAGTYKLTANEIDQLGFKSAKASDLEKLTCVNYRGRFNSDTVMLYGQENGQQATLAEFGKWAESLMKVMDERLENETINEFLINLNSDEMLNKNAALYTQFMTKIGKGDSYVGTELVADWYSTNLHIYTNIQRQIKPTDKNIIVIFGQGHIPILKHLFQTNSNFEIVDVEDLLGAEGK